MSNQAEDQSTELPPLCLGSDEYRQAVERWRETFDPEWLERLRGALEVLCPETFGKHNKIGLGENDEAFWKMLDALPTSFPVQSRIDEKEVVTAGEITLNWREVFKIVGSDRDYIARGLMAATGWDEVVARDMANIVMIAQIEHITRKMKAAMSEAFYLLMQETTFDGLNTWREWQGGSERIPSHDITKSMVDDFRTSVLRRLDNPSIPHEPFRLMLDLDLGEQIH